jgi:hypothetical protein
MLNVKMLRAVKVGIVMLSVVMTNGVMLNAKSRYAELCYVACHGAECRIVMLKFYMFSVNVMSTVMLNFDVVSVMMLNAVMLKVVMLNFNFVSVMLRIIKLDVDILNCNVGNAECHHAE